MCGNSLENCYNSETSNRRLSDLIIAVNNQCGWDKKWFMQNKVLENEWSEYQFK